MSKAQILELALGASAVLASIACTGNTFSNHELEARLCNITTAGWVVMAICNEVSEIIGDARDFVHLNH